jgi:hypothetical protein
MQKLVGLNIAFAALSVGFGVLQYLTVLSQPGFEG